MYSAVDHIAFVPGVVSLFIVSGLTCFVCTNIRVFISLQLSIKHTRIVQHSLLSESLGFVMSIAVAMT